MIEIRWHGRGGQGAFTAARLLGLAAVHEGQEAQAFPSFGPERRGAPVLAFTRLADAKIHDRSDVETCDHVAVLDETLFGPSVVQGLKPGGTLVINTQDGGKYASPAGAWRVVAVDATGLALAVLGRPITNVPLLGALAAATQVVQLQSLLRAVDDQLAAPLRVKNRELLTKVYNLVNGGGRA